MNKANHETKERSLLESTFKRTYIKNLFLKLIALFLQGGLVWYLGLIIFNLSTVQLLQMFPRIPVWVYIAVYGTYLLNQSCSMMFFKSTNIASVQDLAWSYRDYAIEMLESKNLLRWLNRFVKTLPWVIITQCTTLKWGYETGIILILVILQIIQRQHDFRHLESRIKYHVW